LNGIEQRHPFDAYIRFWEALTGEKHVGSHEKACERLEEYFTMKPSSRTSSKNNITTVVILDEIDYLITEKQSILYNLFDWPKRAQANSVGKRLVVVGVSEFL
jgi:origin recognition complex subunit 1